MRYKGLLTACAILTMLSCRTSGNRTMSQTASSASDFRTYVECVEGVGVNGATGEYMSCNCPRHLPYFDPPTNTCWNNLPTPEKDLMIRCQTPSDSTEETFNVSTALFVLDKLPSGEFELSGVARTTLQDVAPVYFGDQILKVERASGPESGATFVLKDGPVQRMTLLTNVNTVSLRLVAGWPVERLNAAQCAASPSLRKYIEAKGVRLD